MKKLFPLLALAAFTVFSLECAIRGGVTGVTALLEPWPMQFSADLGVSLFLIGGWMLRDARARGINALPFVVLLPFAGSIATLAYLVRRSFADAPARHPASLAI